MTEVGIRRLPTLIHVFTSYTFDGEVRVETSLTESARFGFSVGRLLVPLSSGLADCELAELCESSGCDLVIVRASTSRTGLAESLRVLGSRQVIHADKLEYFSWDLLRLDFRDSKLGKIGVTRTTDFSDIQDLVLESFSGYVNHYSANPRLSQNATLDGYLDWARNLMETVTSRTFVTMEPNRGAATGFVLAGIAVAEQTAEIFLNAVASKFRRQGIYRDCMIGAALTMKELDQIKQIVISTQSSNTAVLSAWRDLGLEPWFSVNTFHVMSREV